MNDIAEIKKTNGDCAQYTGTVTVSTYLGDRLIQKETHHNSGLNTLFSFIGDCLQGNWAGAKYNRPCKLTLLEVNSEECLTSAELETATDAQKSKGISTPANDLAIDSDGYHYWSSKYAVCSPIMYDNAALVSLSTDSNGPKGEVTYHFRVPFLSLVGGSSIKKLLLLPTVTTDYARNACAYFVLNNAIKVPEQSGNFTIIIDWTLTFTNKPSTGN